MKRAYSETEIDHILFNEYRIAQKFDRENFDEWCAHETLMGKTLTN